MIAIMIIVIISIFLCFTCFILYLSIGKIGKQKQMIDAQTKIIETCIIRIANTDSFRMLTINPYHYLTKHEN